MTNQVENFIMQYEQENVSAEINANKRILNSFVWILAGIALLWVLTLTNLLEVDKQMATYSFLLAFILYIPTFYLMQKGNLAKSRLKFFLLGQLCMVCAIIMSILSYHTTLLMVFPLLYAIRYREKKVIWFTCAVSLLTTAASTIIGFYFGICDMNILLLGHHSRSWYVSSLPELTLNVPVNSNPLLTILLHIMIPRTLMLLLFSFMMQYTVVSNTRDSLRIAQLTYHKDTDTNTKVYNKNKYEEMISSYYPSVNRLAVIFFDLNNLKKVNDELGHAMGDYIIETLASAIRSQANDGRRAYRVGGDEFVMVLENPVAGEAELIIAAVKEQLRIHNETGPVAISTAAGFAYGKGSSYEDLEKEADEKMYENKHFIKSRLS